MVFESDSPYRDYSGCTVADFIAGSLDTEDGALVIPAYRKLYQAYIAAYEEGHPQEVLLRRLLNSADREVAFLAAQLSTERYQLTVSNFENALTTTGSWLTNFVPKALFRHLDAKAECRLDELGRTLATASAEEVPTLLAEIKKLQDIRRELEKKIKKQ